MKIGCTFILFLLMFFGCRQKQSIGQQDVLVKVDDRTLSLAELKAVLPARLSPADSLIWAES